MQAPVNIEELKNAIRLAEEKHTMDRKLLREQLLMTCETLKPGNLLMSTIKDLFSGPNLTNLVVSTALGLTTRYLSGKMVVGTSAIVLRKILSGILQFSAARILSNNARVPYLFGRKIEQRCIPKNIR